MVLDIKLWNIFTGSFFNNSILGLILSILVFICIMPSIEIGWSKFTFLFYWIGMSGAMAVINFFICVFFYGITEKMDYMQKPIFTMYGMIEALLMGLAELFPNAYLASIQSLKFRYLPLYYHIFSFIIPIFWKYSWIYPIMTGYSFILSWVIIRYYIILKDGSKGDHSDAFAFTQLCPEIMKYFFIFYIDQYLPY